MNFLLKLIIDLVIILIFILGISQFRFPKSARRGNLTAAFALTLAVIVVIFRHRILEPEIVFITVVIGSVIGWFVAACVNMIQIPAMIAFQHGAGGIAAFLISFIELTRNANSGMDVGRVFGVLSLTIGAATFSGSMIASGKLANLIRQLPVLLPKHNLLIIGLIILIVFFGFIAINCIDQTLVYNLLILIGLSIFLGIVFSIRIGGADMPVLISFLNATAGIAAAFCGIIIQNRLLIACGATVTASGSILTHVMCKAMNRSLLNVFKGFQTKATVDGTQILAMNKDRLEESIPTVAKDEKLLEKKDIFSEAVDGLKNSKTIIVIPGYGMAVAQAQFKVTELIKLLEQLGKQVKFAVHPVAGRMPGHMNVLLAEAEVPYDKLFEMEEINSEFKDTDLAIIIGACDVVNPAAITAEGTPISGMPILLAHKARKILVCNLDENPGYSGVENPLYNQKNVFMLLGDAKDTLDRLIKGMLEVSEL